MTTADCVLQRFRKTENNLNSIHNVVNLSNTVQQYDTGGFLMCVVRLELGTEHYEPL